MRKGRPFKCKAVMPVMIGIGHDATIAARGPAETVAGRATIDRVTIGQRTAKARLEKIRIAREATNERAR